MNHMNRTKWIVGTIAVLIVAALLAIFALQYYRINTKYPPTQTQFVKQGTSLKVYGITIQADYTQVLSYNSLLKKYPQCGNSQVEKSQDIGTDQHSIYYLPTVTFTNKTSKEQSFSLIYMTAEVGAAYNGLDMNLFYAINDCDGKSASLKPCLKPGKTITLILPFPLCQSGFSKNEWQHTKSLKYTMVYNLYPIKQVFQTPAVEFRLSDI